MRPLNWFMGKGGEEKGTGGREGDETEETEEAEWNRNEEGRR